LSYPLSRLHTDAKLLMTSRQQGHHYKDNTLANGLGINLFVYCSPTFHL
jgi:hypothetical protein